MDSIILVLNIVIIVLIAAVGFIYYQRSSKQNFDSQIDDQAKELDRKEEISQLKSSFQDSFKIILIIRLSFFTFACNQYRFFLID